MVVIRAAAAKSVRHPRSLFVVRGAGGVSSSIDALDPAEWTFEALGVVGHGVPDCQRKLRFLAALSSVSALVSGGRASEALGALRLSLAALVVGRGALLRYLRREESVERAARDASLSCASQNPSDSDDDASTGASTASERSASSEIAGGDSRALRGPPGPLTSPQERRSCEIQQIFDLRDSE